MTRVIVIGAGIVGCSAAWYLAQGGAEVTVLEAEQVAAAASGRNAGSAEHPLDPRRAALHQESVEIYRELGLAAASPRGILVVSRDPADAAAVREACEQFPELAPELIGGAALRGLEPALADGLSACRLETGYPMQPAAATQRLAELAREAGAVIEEGVGARPLTERGRATGVVAGDGSARHADVVLVAAGAWSSAVIASGVGASTPAGSHPAIPTRTPLGGDPVISAPTPPGGNPVISAPTLPRARPVISALWGVTVEIELPVEVRHRLEEWTPDDAPSRNFEATPLGQRTVLGATRAVAEPDPLVVAESVCARAANFLPGVSGGRVTARRACPRPVTPDGLPVIGAVPGVDDLWIASGHGPLGISLGPASGRVIADAILGRGEPAPEWDPGRFTGWSQVA